MKDRVFDIGWALECLRALDIAMCSSVGSFFVGGRSCAQKAVAMWGPCRSRVEVEDLDDPHRDLASILAGDLPKLRSLTISGVGVRFSRLDRSPRRPHPPVGAAYLAATHDALLSFLLKKKVSCY